MRLSVIEMEKDESIFYNLDIFKKHEDLIVFNIHEFIDFYEEIQHKLRCYKKYNQNRKSCRSTTSN
jgi:hypothetical protein